MLEELGPTLVWSYDKVVGFHCQRKVNVIQYDLRPGVTQPLGEIHTGTDRLVLGGMSDFGGQPQCEWRRRTLVEYVVRLGMRLGLHAAKAFDRFGRASRLYRRHFETPPPTSIYTPLQVSGLASQTWRGVPAPPSRSEVCGWPDVLPPPRYHMHILEARNPYHRVIFVHLS